MFGEPCRRILKNEKMCPVVSIIKMMNFLGIIDKFFDVIIVLVYLNYQIINLLKFSRSFHIYSKILEQSNC